MANAVKGAFQFGSRWYLRSRKSLYAPKPGLSDVSPMSPLKKNQAKISMLTNEGVVENHRSLPLCTLCTWGFVRNSVSVSRFKPRGSQNRGFRAPNQRSSKCCIFSFFRLPDFRHTLLHYVFCDVIITSCCKFA